MDMGHPVYYTRVTDYFSVQTPTKITLGFYLQYTQRLPMKTSMNLNTPVSPMRKNTQKTNAHVETNSHFRAHTAAN